MVPSDEDGSEPTGIRPGCLLALGLFAFGVIAALAVGIFLAGGDDQISLGRLSDYELGSVVYRSDDHLFVVRIPDGRVIALSDLDPHAAQGNARCRVTFRPDLGSAAEGGRFFDACTQSMYDISGRALPDDRPDNRLDMRRVPVQVDGDRLRIRREDTR